MFAKKNNGQALKYKFHNYLIMKFILTKRNFSSIFNLYKSKSAFKFVRFTMVPFQMSVHIPE